MGRTGVSKHLAIPKKAGLVEGRKVGRETRYHLNAAPLREIQEQVARGYAARSGSSTSARRVARTLLSRATVPTDRCLTLGGVNGVDGELIYHIVERSEWDRAKVGSVYRPASLTSEGFIHCSTRS